MKYFKYKVPQQDWNAFKIGWRGYDCQEPFFFTNVNEQDNVEYLIDVIWNEEEHETFTQFRVTPSNHLHWFGGQKELWELSNAEG